VVGNDEATDAAVNIPMGLLLRYHGMIANRSPGRLLRVEEDN
jgi:hypothetical protein